MNPVRDSELQAFERLVELNHTAVHAVAYAITRDLALADDVAQQTFITAWTSRGALRDGTKVRPWLCGIARNQSHKALRRTRRERLGDDVILATLASDASTREQLLAHEEERAVQRALATMPTRYREPLVLFYWEEQSIARVAATLAISEQAAQKRISRGREQLRDNLTGLEDIGRRRRSASAAAISIVAAIAMRSTAGYANTIGATASHVRAGLRGLVACGVGATVMYAVLVPRDVPACPPSPSAPIATENLERNLQDLRRDVVRIAFEQREMTRATVTSAPRPTPSRVATSTARTEPTEPATTPHVEDAVIATCNKLDCALENFSGACCQALEATLKPVSSGVAGLQGYALTKGPDDGIMCRLAASGRLTCD